MPFITPSELAAQEPKAGWTGRFFHSEHMTFAYYDIAPGVPVPLHHHEEEEVWHIIDGELEMVLDGTTKTVGGGRGGRRPLLGQARRMRDPPEPGDHR